ncbi:hypothetical protein PK28_02885 [Hymenobacter sp. DG25B]|uniref:DUF4175 family protein n=1 Tax=Hymenobacter sp. DG25B TaxID=1385664 RepID=UPI000540D7FE|nr:DUF4175 family protein [Hymenobacter sp. DG25B]AIZ62895.1 hypothetical protein PK28_02885 [Hymenobacter sp. DG25B]
MQVLLPALAGLLVLGVVWQRGTNWHTPTLVLGLSGLTLLLWYLFRLWQPDLAHTARQLNRLYPELEDSAGLLLRQPDELSLLESLQQQHVINRLAVLSADQLPLLPVAWRPTILLTAGLLLMAGGLSLWKSTSSIRSEAAPALAIRFPESPAAAGQPTAPRLLDTRILISPPAYTRQATSAASQPSFRCPEGSLVRWTVRVSRAAKQPPQLILGKQTLPFRPVAGQANTFTAQATLTSSVLYHLRFAGQNSDDYAINVQPDQAPTVRIQTPKPYTLVEFGMKPQVPVRVLLQDDYGLTRARLVATVAQGQGEAVKFREVATELSGGLRGQPAQATLAHLLRLPQLGLTYGDEVYFYVQTWDNHQRTARSDSYLVQWEDTTVDDSGTDMALGVNMVPAYFRSQRQIIIDTEKLLSEKRGLPQATLLERSNTIGYDQKVLRLRYGQFMGEEFSESIGDAPVQADSAGSAEKHEGAEEHGHHDEHAAPATSDAAGDAARLMEPYVHAHDDAETADFLEPAVKAKLSIVLSQMWEAELRLRTGQPAAALPFEYKALRLLKQVQQQTRAYVKKSGFEPPVFPEATLRLTGELGNASGVAIQRNVPAPTSPQKPAQAALAIVQRLQQGAAPAATDALVLEQAGQALAQKALNQPGTYLGALRELRTLTGRLRAKQPPCRSCLPVIERALLRLLPAARPAPVRQPGPGRLSQRYFQELR